MGNDLDVAVSVTLAALSNDENDFKGAPLETIRPDLSRGPIGDAKSSIRTEA